MTDRKLDAAPDDACRESAATVRSERGLPTQDQPPVIAVMAVLLGCCVLLGFGFQNRGLWSGYEGRGAQYAQGMLDMGHWGLPRLFWQDPDLQKPPLYYWLIAATAIARGGVVDEFAVRFPALVSALLLLALVYALAAHWWGRSAGILAAAILTTMPRFWWLARVGRLDMPLTLCTTVALACLWIGLAGRKSRPARFISNGWMLAAYGAMGLGVLFKGPIALVLAAAAVTGFLALEAMGRRERCGLRTHLVQSWQRIRGLRPAWGLLIVLAVAGPWFVWCALQTNGELWSEFFIYHNWQRAVGGADALEGRPPWYYLGPLTADTFPWSLLAGAALIAMLRSSRRILKHIAANSARDTPLSFCAGWLLGMLAFLSLVQFKRQDYLLPLYPAMALLVAGILCRPKPVGVFSHAIQVPRAAFAAAAGLIFIGALAISVCLWLPASGQLFGITTRELGGLRSSRIVTTIIAEMRSHPLPWHVGLGAVAACALAAILQCIRRRYIPAGAALALALAAAEASVMLGVLPTMDRLRNQRPFARLLRETVPPGATIVYHRMENHDLVFYTGAPAEVVVSSRDLRHVLEHRRPVYLVLRRRCRDRCEGSCIGGCLRRRREQWPELPLTVLATNRGRGDAKEWLALVTNGPRVTSGLARRTLDGRDSSESSPTAAWPSGPARSRHRSGGAATSDL